MAGINVEETAVSAWIAAREGEMIALLERLVNTDSGSYDKAGVDAAGAILKDFFRAQGLAVETVPHATHGEAIRAVLAAPTANDQRPIVLMGHRDTVFGKGESGRRPFRIEDGKGYGPGVVDMKAGLVANAYAIAAMKACGIARAPVVALVTSDEEIASPSSRPVIEAEARGARAVLNSEPKRESGNIVSGRKGGVFMAFEVEGKAAHSGANFDKGVSAIEELARKVVALHKLTDLPRGITVNVGLISGGQTVNTVAPWAKGEIDLRYVKGEDRAPAIARIREIVETCSLAGTKGRLEIKGEFLPLEETPASRALAEIYAGIAADLAAPFGTEFTGGCADSGYTAAQGCPTLCGVGPSGGKGHTAEEYVNIASIVPASQMLALTAMRIGARV